MAIFLDTGKIEEIRKYHKLGIVRGVTTNPSIMLRDGIKGGMDAVKACSIEIAKLIAPWPVSVEVTTNDRDEILAQADEFTSWAKNINVKVTIHGPNGELDNLAVIHELETKKNIRVNCTAMMSVQQCFLAALAGASYVSLFSGRINDMGYDSVVEIKKLRKLLDDFNLKAQIIAASSRETYNVADWLHAGAHIVTVAPELINKMLVHPFSKETVKQFMADAEKANIVASKALK